VGSSFGCRFADSRTPRFVALRSRSVSQPKAIRPFANSLAPRSHGLALKEKIAMRRRPHCAFAVVALSALVFPQVSRAEAAAPAEAAPPPPPAEPPPPPPPSAAGPSFLSIGGDWKLAFHGFAGGSFYVQDTPAFVFNGQGPLIPLSKPAYGYTTGADIRQTRFSLAISGPKVLGATPKALIEMDFFGLNGPGGYGEVSVLPRLRLAYTELNWGNDIIRIGQDHELIIGLTPESIGHQAYPVTYFNGFIGWREPGIGYYHTIPTGEESKLELALQVIKSDWENPADFGSSSIEDLNVDFGQLSGWPGVEARIKFSSPNVMAFVAGHYNHVEGSHAETIAVPPGVFMYGGAVGISGPPSRDWDVYAGTAGFKVTGAGLTLAANAYYGRTSPRSWVKSSSSSRPTTSPSGAAGASSATKCPS
jgi:hypothetical protein